MAYSQDEIQQKATALINAGAAKEDVLAFINQAQSEAGKQAAPAAQTAPAAPSNAPQWVATPGSPMMGMLKHAPEELPMIMSKETSDTIRSKIDEYQSAKTPEERMDLVKNWGKELGSLAGAQGVKVAGPVIGSRLGMPGRVVGGMAGEALGNLVSGEPTTGGGVLAAGVRSIANPQVHQSVMNAIKFIGGDAAAAQLKSLVDQGQFADARTMANVARNGTIAAMAIKQAGPSGRAEAEMTKQLRDKPLVDAYKEAHDLGITLDPNKFSELGGPISRTLEQVAGQTDVQKAASRMNRPVVDNLMRRYADLSEAAPINPANFSLLRAEAQLPYSQLSSISKKAENAVEQWRRNTGEVVDLTKSLKTAQSNEARNSFRDALEKAQAKADASFDEMKNIATNAGKGSLIPALEEARIRTAELHTIENGFNEGVARGFDASVLGDLFDARVPMRGPMLTIGRLASTKGHGAMPEVFGSPYDLPKINFKDVVTMGVPQAAKAAVLSRFLQGQAIPKYGTGEMSVPANITQFAIRNQ